VLSSAQSFRNTRSRFNTRDPPRLEEVSQPETAAIHDEGAKTSRKDAKMEEMKLKLEVDEEVVKQELRKARREESHSTIIYNLPKADTVKMLAGGQHERSKRNSRLENEPIH